VTGAFIRVERLGKFENVEFDQLTDEELESMAQQYPEKGWSWAKFLAAWIRDNVREEDGG